MNRNEAYLASADVVHKQRATRLTSHIRMIREATERGEFQIRLRLTRLEYDDLVSYGFDVKFPWFSRGQTRTCLVKWRYYTAPAWPTIMANRKEQS